MHLNAAVKRFGPWAVLEYLVNPVLTLVSTPLIIKNLGIATFGAWVIIIAIVSLTVAITSGASTALARYIAANNVVRPDLVQSAQLDTFSVISATSLLAAATAAAILHFSNAAQVVPINFGWLLLIIVMLTVMIDSADTIFLAVLRGELRYAASARVETIARIFQFSFIIGVVYTIPSIIGLAGASCVGSLVRMLLRYRSCNLSWLTVRMFWQHRLKKSSPVLASVGWATLQNLGNAFYTSVDRFVIASAFGPTTLALYAVASQLTNQIQAVIGAAFSVISNATARREEATDYQALIRVCLRLTVIVAFGAITLYGFFFAIAGLIFSSWLGPATASQLLPLVPAVVIAATIQTISFPAHFFLLGAGRFKLVAILGLVAGILSLVFLWGASKWFMPQYALVARAAYGLFLFSYFFVLIRALSTAHNSKL